MANILPVSDLRNYNEVLKNCHKGEPVYLTKNGRGRFVIMDIEDYERDRAEKKLLLKLQEGRIMTHIRLQRFQYPPLTVALGTEQDIKTAGRELGDFRECFRDFKL